MAKIFKYIGDIAKELLFVLGLWSIKNDQSLTSSIQNFANLNASFWSKKTPLENDIGISKETTNILIEGHLSEYGPNYLFRTALAAKAIEESIKNTSIDIVVNGFSHQWQTSKIAYESFNIDKWIYLGRKFIFLDPILIVFAFINASISFLKMTNVKSIIELSIGNIKIGDLVYDQVMRSTKIGTIDKLNWSVFITIVRSYHYYYQYSIFFWFKNYNFFISTHSAYPEYGILLRVALKNKIVVLETTDIQTSIYDKNVKDFKATYHQGIQSLIANKLKNLSEGNKKIEKIARQKLIKRFSNQLDQIDAQKSYTGNVYDRASFNEEIKNIENKKIGFIFAHIFIDSPHLSQSMLFLDYYIWLKKTIEICSTSTDMIWVVKPHPSSEIYNEVGKVEQLVEKYGKGNVLVCPKNFNTKSLINCADVITTVHGTVGLEFSCVGIPVILAGVPFYSGFGFTEEPKNIQEYTDALIHASTLTLLKQDKINKALRVFSIWEDIFDWNNPIIDSKVQARVWGSGVERDLSIAYKILCENLKQNNPRSLKLWKVASSMNRYM